MTEIRPTGTGIHQHVSAERIKSKTERFDEAVRVAGISGDHVWVALVSHHVHNPEEFVKSAHLDSESVVSVGLGCYVCEELFQPRLLRRRCPGQPRR
jgi:hypothetical protein